YPRGPCPRPVAQWPSQCRRLRGLRGRRWAPALCCAGGGGNGKNVPSGNSRYRLKTCTSSSPWPSPWPSPLRRPSITNLVPTGKRLGRRLELYTMTSSCDATALPVQYVSQLTRSVSWRVIHPIPSYLRVSRKTGLARPRHTDVIVTSRIGFCRVFPDERTAEKH